MRDSLQPVMDVKGQVTNIRTLQATSKWNPSHTTPTTSWADIVVEGTSSIHVPKRDSRQTTLHRIATVMTKRGIKYTTTWEGKITGSWDASDNRKMGDVNNLRGQERSADGRTNWEHDSGHRRPIEQYSRYANRTRNTGATTIPPYVPNTDRHQCWRNRTPTKHKHRDYKVRAGSVPPQQMMNYHHFTQRPAQNVTWN